MSENTFPFGGDEALPYDDEPSGDDRQRKLLFGGLAAVVVLAGGYLLLGGGGSEDVVQPSAVARTPRVAAAPLAAKAPVRLPVAYKDQMGRDPFRALYVQPAAAPAAPVAPPAAPAAVPIVVVAPAAPAAGPTGSTGSATTTGTAMTYKLVLNRVYGSGADRTAVFTIDGKQQVAKIGTKFGPTSEIILLSFKAGPKPGQWTTSLQVGDGDPFDVMTGVPAYVR